MKDGAIIVVISLGTVLSFLRGLFWVALIGIGIIMVLYYSRKT